MAKKLTDIMKPGDWLIHQTRHGNWVVGQATRVEENGDICTAVAAYNGYAECKYCRTRQEALDYAKSALGLVPTWHIGYHRYKLEPERQ